MTAVSSPQGVHCQFHNRAESRIKKQRQQAMEVSVAFRLHADDSTCTVLRCPLALASARLSPDGAHGPRRRKTARPCATAWSATRRNAGVQDGASATQENARAKDADRGAREGGSGWGKGEGMRMGSGEDEERGAERPLWSVVIPTYNRLPILRKCLAALEAQALAGEDGAPVLDFEVVVVDDGSSDGTVPFLAQQGRTEFPHARLLCQEHGGAAMARNLGVQCARGSTVVFIDSDLVVSPHFLAAHWRRLREARERWGDERSFSYGRVVNTSNFEDPQSEPFKLTDLSAAFFATGNVAIARSMLQEAAHLLRPLHAAPGTPGAPLAASPSSDTTPLNGTAQPMRPGVDSRSMGAGATAEAVSPAERATASASFAGHLPGCIAGEQGTEAESVPWVGPGPFDPEFRTYGWEDLELGERLRLCGARIVQCPEAVGFHWHRAFSLDQLEGDIRRERERGRNAVRFFLKHPASLHVRLMLQLTPFHWFLWGLLTLGGLVSEVSLRPLLRSLLAKGHTQAASALLVPVFNWHYMLAMDQELKRIRG